MLSREENERITRVGPGTPMGELLRRYWYPVAASSEMMEHPTKLVRILGETLVLYRDRRGKLGLIDEYCPHRRASLLYGIPEQEGLRCAYHGWRFDGTGKCLEQPAEPAESTYRERVRIKAYPVQELGGLIFGYLGPQPVPLLPRWELLLRDDLPREIGVCEIPCNWLQIMENSVDPVHVEWLHRHFYNYVMERLRREEKCIPVRHEKIGFDVFQYGIIKRRVLEGETEQDENWKVGHPVLFPNILVSGSPRTPVYQIRVPVDDARTTHYWYTCYRSRPEVSVPKPGEVPIFRVPVPGVDDEGQPQWTLLDNNGGQDAAMWITQGPIADRSLEKLGESDQGVILLRKLCKEQLEKVERGEDPVNVFRDPAENDCLKVHLEENKARRSYRRAAAGNASKYSPLLSDLEKRGADIRDILVGSAEKSD